MTIGETIKTFREAKGMSQKELGKEIHISQSAIALWERGVNFPTYNNLVALARVLEIDDSNFCKIKQEQPRSTDTLVVMPKNLNEAFALIQEQFDIDVSELTISFSDEITIKGRLIPKQEKE